jgi:hypothetical protein
MRVAFRQGIIDYQQDGGVPQFVQPGSAPGYLSLNVSPTPTIVTVAHGDSNYLIRFDADANNVWGPLQPGIPNYLYWEVDLVSGQVKYGITLINPVASPVEPVSPQIDQHWFDLSTTTMKVWNGTKWVETARLFAATCPIGTTSVITAQPIGSQVGLNTPAQAGYIVFDTLGRPVRGIGLQLLTSATPVRMKTSVGTSGVLTNPLTTVVWARATEDMPAFTLVYFSGDGQIARASGDPVLAGLRTPVGIITDNLSANEAGMVTQYGELSWDGWDWSGNIGKPLYCNQFGELTLLRPGGLIVYRVGFINGRRSILFQVDAETHQELAPPDAGIVISGDLPIVVPPPVLNPLNEQVFSVSIQEATPTQPGYMPSARVVQLDDHEVRIADIELALPLKSDVGHTHAIADVSNLQTQLNGKADVGHTHTGVYAPFIHGHPVSEIIGLQGALDDKANVVHSHSISDVNNLQTELNSKALVNHTHTISDVSGLQSALDSKADISHNHDTQYSPLGHTHTISDVSGLQLALDGKAAIGHNHDTQYSPLGHTHTISDVSGLQLALDGKADISHNHDLTYALIAHTHSASNITDFDEAVDDRVGSLLVAGTNVTLNYDDSANTLTISAAGGGGYTAPSTEIVIGAGSNNDSSPNFTYDKNTGDFKVNEFGPDNGDGEVLISSGMNGSGMGSSLIAMNAPGVDTSSIGLYAGSLSGESGALIFLSGASPSAGGNLELRAGNSSTPGGGASVFIASGTTGGSGAGKVCISSADTDGFTNLPGGNILLSTTTDGFSVDLTSAELAVTSSRSVAVGSPDSLSDTSETGFLFIPTIDSTPSAPPAESFGARSPIVYEPGNQQLWAYDGSNWHSIGAVAAIGDTYRGYCSTPIPYAGTFTALDAFASTNNLQFTDAGAGNAEEIYFTRTGYYKIIVQCRLDNVTPSGAFPDGSFVHGIKITAHGSDLQGYGGEPATNEMTTRHIRYQAAADLSGCPVANVDRWQSWTDTFVINVPSVDDPNYPAYVTFHAYAYKNGHIGGCSLSFNITFIRLGEHYTGF